MKEAYEKLGKNLYLLAMQVKKHGYWPYSESKKKDIVRRELRKHEADPLKLAALYDGCNVARPKWTGAVVQCVDAARGVAGRKLCPAQPIKRSTVMLRVHKHVERKALAAFADLPVMQRSDNVSVRFERKAGKVAYLGCLGVRSMRAPHQKAYWKMDLTVNKTYFQEVVDKGLHRPRPNVWVLAAAQKGEGEWYAKWAQTVKRGYKVTNHYGIMRRDAEGRLTLDQSSGALAQYAAWACS